MRTVVQFLVLAALVAALGPSAAAQERDPPFATMTATRMLVLPAQEVGGAPEPKLWMARFDSVLTARLEDGGIGAGWAYPRDAIRVSRSNPTYTTDPHMMGVQPLKATRVGKDFPLPEPFASRLRALMAIANARVAVVSVVAHVDSTKKPPSADVLVMFADATTRRIIWRGMIETHYAGAPSVAADSLAVAVARLFVKN